MQHLKDEPLWIYDEKNLEPEYYESALRKGIIL
jgi:hypothetical protein